MATTIGATPDRGRSSKPRHANGVDHDSGDPGRAVPEAMTAVATPHHGLPVHEVALLVETDRHRGLSDVEAVGRLLRFGPNTLPSMAGTRVVVRVVRQFHNPLIYVLLVAAIITSALGELVDSGVIFGVVVINAVVGFIQESKAEAALEGLRSMVHTTAKVIRDGHQYPVPSDDLVPGDLVLVDAGDKVPADLRLIRAAEFHVDESALTGESAPVVKDELLVLPEATPVADRRNMAYAGTLVTAGSGAGIVVATGAETELGEIHRLVGAAQSLATPLTAKLAKFSNVLTVGILALAALTFAIGLLRRQDAAETFTAAIALAVGAIPEGLPAAVTITLAIGVARMAKRRTVVRRLPAVETLGGTTVICADKTGTLTENQMTVEAIWTPEVTVELTGTGYTPIGELLDQANAPAPVDSNAALRWSLIAGAWCNDATLVDDDGRWKVLGDPTEGAMLVAAAKAGLARDENGAELPRMASIPFTSERQYMATLHRTDDGNVVLAKGAVERILEMCCSQLGSSSAVQPLDREAVLNAAQRMSNRGLRVLATGMRTAAGADDLVEDQLPGTLTLTGLQAMADPLRTAATSAVAACHTAGIAVKMITGDHAATATAVAAKVGLLDDEPAIGAILTGSDLAELASEDYADAVDRASVFARVSPEQKLRLVEALQSKGHVVAMTGDGVNDAPALQQANIGVAMGRSGSEVAKDAADMVLTDDDFATIEAAVEEGRGVFDNLTKFIIWTLPTNIGEGLVIAVAIAIGTVLPILPTQILWINMTTAVTLGLMLAFEPKDAAIMARPPRDPARPLLTRGLVSRILLISVLLVASTWWLFEWELSAGASLPEARTSAVNLFVAVEALYLFSCRSPTHSAWRIGMFSNRWIVLGVTVQAILQLSLTYLPAMNTVFGTAPVGFDVWLRILALAVGVSMVVAVDKTLRRCRRVKPSPTHINTSHRDHGHRSTVAVDPTGKTCPAGPSRASAQ